MATNHWGNCCSNKLCSMLSAISSTIGFINGKWCHGSDYTPVTSDSNMCLHVSRENKSISFKHATCSVWGNKQSALFVPYNKQCGCECVGGGQGTKPHSTYAVYRTRMIISFQVLQTKTISFAQHIHLKLFIFLSSELLYFPNSNHWWCSRCFLSSVTAVALDCLLLRLITAISPEQILKKKTAQFWNCSDKHRISHIRFYSMAGWDIRHYINRLGLGIVWNFAILVPKLLKTYWKE